MINLSLGIIKGDEENKRDWPGISHSRGEVVKWASSRARAATNEYNGWFNHT